MGNRVLWVQSCGSREAYLEPQLMLAGLRPINVHEYACAALWHKKIHSRFLQALLIQIYRLIVAVYMC